MKNQIQVLKEAELLGRQFKVYGSAEEPMFLAKDIAQMLSVSNVADLVSRVDEEERGIVLTDTLGGKQQMWFLTEDGLYEVLMQSRKPIAKSFKKEIKKILKEVRISGGYIATKGNETPEEVMAKALIVANATLERIERERKELAEQNQRLLHSNKLYTSTEIAKELGLKSAIQLNNILSDNKIQFKQNGTWILYSKYADKGYVSIKQDILDNGRVIYDRKWTGIGRDFLLTRFSSQTTS